jgi:hypothetical protein
MERDTEKSILSTPCEMAGGEPLGTVLLQIILGIILYLAWFCLMGLLVGYIYGGK